LLNITFYFSFCCLQFRRTDSVVCGSDDLISRFQFWYDINTIFWKYRCIDIAILKMISM